MNKKLAYALVAYWSDGSGEPDILSVSLDIEHLQFLKDLVDQTMPSQQIKILETTMIY